MAPHVGVFFLVSNGSADAPAGVVRTRGAMGDGFADAVDMILNHATAATAT